MADYIDRELVRRIICRWCVNGECLADDKAWENCYAKGSLYNLPSADVQPVVHGEWIAHRGNWADEFECSVCHKITKTLGHFCPNCGARLD